MIAHFLFVELGIEETPRWTPWFDEGESDVEDTFDNCDDWAGED